MPHLQTVSCSCTFVDFWPIRTAASSLFRSHTGQDAANFHGAPCITPSLVIHENYTVVYMSYEKLNTECLFLATCDRHYPPCVIRVNTFKQTPILNNAWNVCPLCFLRLSNSYRKSGCKNKGMKTHSFYPVQAAWHHCTSRTGICAQLTSKASGDRQVEQVIHQHKNIECGHVQARKGIKERKLTTLSTIMLSVTRKVFSLSHTHTHTHTRTHRHTQTRTHTFLLPCCSTCMSADNGPR